MYTRFVSSAASAGGPALRSLTCTGADQAIAFTDLRMSQVPGPYATFQARKRSPAASTAIEACCTLTAGATSCVAISVHVAPPSALRL